MRGTAGSAAQPVREGIVAYSTVRFAAGAGVVVASLLIVGPNPAQAVADKHGSGNRIEDYRKNGSSGYPKGGASNWAGLDEAEQDSKSNLDPPLMDSPAVGGDPGDLAVVNSFAAEDEAPALRSASIAAPPVGDNVAAAAPRTGARNSGQPATSFRAPRVVFGNGRTPGAHTRTQTPESVLSYDSLDATEAVPAAPAVPDAIEIDIPPLPPLPPVEQMRPAELVVGEFATGTADTMTDPLAGVGGLILIPTIGAVLGYRQARAAQSLRESLRS